MKKFIYLFALILMITGTIAINPTNVSAGNCTVLDDSFGFLPSGMQDSGWFQDSKTQTADVTIKTSGCKNTEITLDIYIKNIVSSDKVVVSKKVTVPNSEYFNIRFKVGTIGCSNTHDPDCTYYFNVRNNDSKDFLFKNKTLEFNCDSGCTNDKIPWVFDSLNEIPTTPIVLGNCGDGIDNDNDKLVDEKDPDCLDSGVGFSPPFYMTTNLESGRYTKLDEAVAAIEARKKIDDAKNNNISNQSSGYGISPQSAKEDNTYHLLAPIPGMKDDFVDGSQQIGDYINNMFKIFLGLCAALAVIMIIIYGVTWMGTDSVFGKTEAKSKIGGAIGGLLLALGAWVILNTINPDLLGGAINIKQASLELEGNPMTENDPAPADGTKTGKCTAGIDPAVPTSGGFFPACKDTAPSLQKMINDAWTAGFKIYGYGFRSYEKQLKLREKNCPDKFNSPSSACTPPTAKPGTSNHESGQAFDLTCEGATIRARDNKCYLWLKNNAKNYGFYNLGSEPWHWSVDGK